MVTVSAQAIFGVTLALQRRLLQDLIQDLTFLLWCRRQRCLLHLRLLQGTRGGDALAFGELHLGRPPRCGEAQSVEHPVLSNSAEVTHQSFVLVLQDRSDHFVGPAHNHSRVNSCKVEEAQDVSNKRGVNFCRKANEERKLTIGPKAEDGHKIRYWNTLYPAVFSQPAGDRPAGPDREAAARDKLLDEIPGAEGLRELPEQREQSLVFGSGVGSDLRHIAKSGDVVNDKGMGFRL